MNDKIVGMPQPDSSKLRKAIEEIKRQAPEQIELAQLIAADSFNKFKAFKSAGFSDDQAMRLLCAERMKASV